MTFPSSTILTGSFVSNGTSQTLTLPSDIVKFELFDITYFGSTAGTATEAISWWVKGLPAGSAYIGNKTNGAATIAITSMSATGGFTFSDPTAAALSGATAISGITNANPAVVSTASTTGLNSGDTVRIYGTTGALQIAGMDFTIDTIVANTSFNLTYIGGAPGSAASAGFWRRVNVNSPYYPKARFITNITQATSAVITMSVAHGYTVGQQVRVYVPVNWGMTQLNAQLVTITAVTTSTITINVDTTGYTAFAYPTTVQAGSGQSFAQVVPVGEAAINTSTYPFANLLDDATRNQSAYTMTMGASVVGASNDTMRWIAYRGLSI